MGPNVFLRTTNFRLWWIHRLGSRFGSGSVIPGARMGRPARAGGSEPAGGRAEVRQGCGGRKKREDLLLEEDRRRKKTCGEQQQRHV